MTHDGRTCIGNRRPPTPLSKNRRAPWSLKMKAPTSLPLALGLAAAATVGAFAPARTNSRSAAAPLAVTLEGRQIAEGGDLKPVNNFVLVKVAEIQDKTDSGILLTGSVSFVLCFRLCPCNSFGDECMSQMPPCHFTRSLRKRHQPPFAYSTRQKFKRQRAKLFRLALEIPILNQEKSRRCQ